MIVARPVFFASSSSRTRRHGWLGSTALLGLSLTIASVATGLGSGPAFAGGGASSNGAPGGTDSPTGAGGTGANGIGVSDGGAGGGAGATGGSGGNGLAFSGGGLAGTGGTGGSAAGQAGTAGGAASGTASAGGGGGGGGAHGGVGATLPGSFLTGGSGGTGGGAPNPIGIGGGGGAGGYGYVVTGTGSLGTLGSSVTGGAGGVGGAGTALGGNGGTGGTGLYFNAAGATATIGAAVNGGNGGAAGSGAGGTGGAGGAGIVGSDLTITMSTGGSVTGGLSGDGITRANAITFTGGTNAISFFDTTSHLTGNIDVTGTVQLNTAIGAGTFVPNAITGSGGVILDSHGILWLLGANTYSGATTITSGSTLAANAPGTLSANSDFTVNGQLTLWGFSNTIKSLSGNGLVSNIPAATLTIAPASGVTTFSGKLIEASSTQPLSLIKTGAGTQVLSGANTYTGTTDVNAGTLAVTGSIGSAGTPAGAIGVLAGATLSVGATGSVNIAGHNLTNAGTVTVASGGSITDDLINSGTVSNAGTYNAKVASNTGTITNTNIWNGDVLSNAGGIVNAAGATWTGNISTGGSFTNNGTISGAVTVSGGTFKGTGSSGGMTIGSGAVFAPGSGTPGTSAAVNGSLAFSSGAFYQVAINPTTASFVSATGTATLGGASVQAFFSSGTYVAKQYTILNATGGVNGTFNTLANTNLPSGFTSTLSYDATHAYLDLKLAYAPPGGVLTVNQHNVATTLANFFNSNGSIPIVFGALTPAGLTQASGELATATQQTSFDAMNLFMGVMTDPFMARRGGVASSGGATGYADEANAYAARRKPNDALAAIYTKARPMTPAFERRWSTWVAGYGGSQSTGGNAALGSNDTTSSVYGTAVGADYRLSLETVAGFALAGGGTNFNVNGAGYGRSDLFQAGAFLRHTHGPAYITGALAYGWQDITTNRTVMVAGIDRLRAQFNANTWSGRLEGGYRFVAPVFGGVGLTPYAAGQVTTFDLPSYTESVLAGAGAFALAYNAKSVTDTRSELGLRADKSYAMLNGILTLRGRTAWAHDFNPDRSIAATFQTLPGASFVVNGAAQAHDSLLSSEAVEFKWANGWSAAATFDSEYSSVATTYAGKGVLRYTW